jgi:hypothetical protein
MIMVILLGELRVITALRNRRTGRTTRHGGLKSSEVSIRRQARAPGNYRIG